MTSHIHLALRSINDQKPELLIGGLKHLQTSRLLILYNKTIEKAEDCVYSSIHAPHERIASPIRKLGSCGSGEQFGNGIKENIMVKNFSTKKIVIVLLFSVIIVVGYIIYINSIIGKNENRFYLSRIESIVIRKEVSWMSGNSNAYYLKNDLKIFLAFNKENQISVGDSIFKEPNTYIYNVYKKNHKGRYEHSGTYDFNEVY